MHRFLDPLLLTGLPALAGVAVSSLLLQAPGAIEAAVCFSTAGITIITALLSAVVGALVYVHKALLTKHESSTHDLVAAKNEVIEHADSRIEGLRGERDKLLVEIRESREQHVGLLQGAIQANTRAMESAASATVRQTAILEELVTGNRQVIEWLKREQEGR